MMTSRYYDRKWEVGVTRPPQRVHAHWGGALDPTSTHAHCLVRWTPVCPGPVGTPLRLTPTSTHAHWVVCWTPLSGSVDPPRDVIHYSNNNCYFVTS